MLLPILILVILGCIYAGSLKTSKSRLTVVVFILVIILILCYIQMSYKNKEMFSGFNGYSPLNYVMTNGGLSNETKNLVFFFFKQKTAYEM